MDCKGFAFAGGRGGKAPSPSLLSPRRHPHQFLTGADLGAWVDCFAEGEALGGEHDDGGTVFEPAHFLTLLQRSVTGEGLPLVVGGTEGDVEEVQADTGDQDGG